MAFVCIQVKTGEPFTFSFKEFPAPCALSLRQVRSFQHFKASQKTHSLPFHNILTNLQAVMVKGNYCRLVLCTENFDGKDVHSTIAKLKAGSCENVPLNLAFGFSPTGKDLVFSVEPCEGSPNVPTIVDITGYIMNEVQGEDGDSDDFDDDEDSEETGDEDEGEVSDEDSEDEGLPQSMPLPPKGKLITPFATAQTSTKSPAATSVTKSAVPAEISQTLKRRAGEDNDECVVKLFFVEATPFKSHKRPCTKFC